MWIRKSNEQVAKERSRVWLSFREPALLFLVCFILDFGIAVSGPRHDESPWPDTWFKMFRDATAIATVVAMAGYILQVVFRRKLAVLIKPVKVVICDTCHQVKHRDGKSKCGCGGTFDDFDKWTWIDENEGPRSG